MLYLMKLALRNVGRNRRRSLLACISVGISLMVIVFLQGWMSGIMESFVKNSTKNDTGHLRIAAKKFEEKYRFLPVTDNVRDPKKIIAAIENDKRIAGKIALITERISFGVLLSRGPNAKSAVALAGDPEKEKRLLLLQKSIVPGGRYLEGPRELIMGSSLAKSLKYLVGDTVRVMTSGSDWALHLKKFVVVGFFKTGLLGLDDMVFQIRLDDARDLLRMEDEAQQIVIMLRDYREADNVAEYLRAKISDTTLSVTPWTKIGDTYATIRLIGNVYNWIFVIIALLGAFIISNIMMMVVMERRKEIGILKSMGVTKFEVLFCGEPGGRNPRILVRRGAAFSRHRHDGVYEPRGLAARQCYLSGLEHSKFGKIDKLGRYFSGGSIAITCAPSCKNECRGRDKERVIHPRPLS